MSFQAYLDNIEEKTGKTPQELIDEANANGFGKHTKADEILTWLKDVYGLGRGHGMAIVHVIKNGTKIDSKFVGKSGAHGDKSDTLILTGKKNIVNCTITASHRHVSLSPRLNVIYITYGHVTSMD